MHTSFKKTLLSAILGLSLSVGAAMAAEVPAGTQLADKQELTWNKY